MASSRAEMTYAAALNRNELFGTPTIHTVIPQKVLDPDEEVLLVLLGVASDYPDILVVTDRRTMLVQVGGVIRRVNIKREIAPTDVLGATFKGGALHRIRLEVRGQRELKMLPNRKADASRFCEELNQLIATGRRPA